MPTYFITGANRGLGREAVKQLLDNPENRVIATCRHLEDLPELLVTKNRNLVILRLDYDDLESFIHLSKELDRLQWPIDVFIANAALNTAQSGVLASLPQEYESFFRINAVGPIETLKVIMPFMMLSKTRKIVFKSSVLGSINGYPWDIAKAFPCAPYCVSKAALNMMCKELSYELRDEGFIVISYHPGLINTKSKELNDDVSVKEGFKPDQNFVNSVTKETLTIEEGIKKELAVIDSLTLADTGKFWTHTGESIPF